MAGKKIPVSKRQVEKRNISFGDQSKAQVTETVGGFNQQNMEKLQTLTRQATEIAVKEQKRVDDIHLDQIERDYEREYNKLMYDKKSGFTSQVKGINTLEGQTEYKKRYDEFTETRLKGLPDRLMNRANLVRDKYRSDFDLNSTKHTNSEMAKYEQEQFSAHLDTIQESASFNFDKVSSSGESMASEGLKKQNNRITRYAKDQGWSKERTEAFRLQESSKYHSNVINAAVDSGKDLLAREYFKEAKKKKEIDRATADKLHNLLDAAEVDGRAQSIVDEMMNQYNAGGDPQALLSQTRKKLDGKVEDEVVKRFKNRLTEKKNLEVFSRDAMLQKDMELVEQARNMQELMVIPLSEKQAWTAKGRKAMDRILAAKLKGGKIYTDPVIYERFRTMAADPKTQRKFIDTDFREWADKLSAADVKAFGQLKAAIIKGDAKAEKANKTFLTNKQALDAQLEAAKITSKPSVAAVYNKVRAAEEQWQQDNKMKYTPQDEFNEIVKSVIGGTQKSFLG
jgi:hypothetical protein